MNNNETLGSQSPKLSPHIPISNKNVMGYRKNPELVINDLFSEHSSSIKSPPKNPDNIMKEYYDFDVPKTTPKNRRKLEVIF